MHPTRKAHAGLNIRKMIRVADAGKAPAAAMRPHPVQPRDDSLDKARGEIAAMLLWLALWMFNGGCTVYSWISIMRWLSVKLVMTDRWYFDPIFHVFVGIVVHVVISSIEQNLWKNIPLDPDLPWHERIGAMLKSVKTWESVGIGGLDSFSTSNALFGLAVFLGAPSSLTLVVVVGLMGTSIAMASEPMLKHHGFSFRSLIGR